MRLKPIHFFLLFLPLLPFNSLNAQGQEHEMPLSELSKEKQAEAMYFDAIKAGMQNDDKQQEEILKKLTKDRSEEAAPYYDLSRLYLKQNKLDLAESFIKKAIDRNKNNIWYKRTQAEIFIYQGNWLQAAELLAELSKSELHSEEFLFQAVKLYEKANKYKEAIALLDQLLDKNSQDEELLLEKQKIILEKNKDVEGALKIAQQLINQNPKEGRFYINLGEIYFNSGQKEKTFEIYSKALKELPDDAELQYGIAVYYKKTGDENQFHFYIQKAILNQTFEMETQVNLLIGYLQDIANDPKRMKEGLKLTEQLIDQNPTNANLIALYGQVLWNMNQQEDAAFQFKKSLALDPSSYNIWQQLLVTYTAPNKADSLIKYSEKALKLYPNQAMLHYLNGIGWNNKKNYTKSIASIQRAIDLQPDESKELLSDMYAAMGDAYNADKNFKASDESYEKAISLNPNNVSVLNNYSYYLSVRKQRLEYAEKMSKKTLELKPGEATFLDTYGWILFQQGKYELAKKYIEDALKANPEADGTLWEHLGDVYFKLNLTEKAVEYWIKAKERGTENKGIDQKIQDRKYYE